MSSEKPVRIDNRAYQPAKTTESMLTVAVVGVLRRKAAEYKRCADQASAEANFTAVGLYLTIAQAFESAAAEYEES